MKGYSIRKAFLMSRLQGKRLFSAKNHFSEAEALMCVTGEWYGLLQGGQHHYVQRRAHFTFTIVSLSQYVKIIANGRFSQTRSHIFNNVHSNISVY